MTRKNFEKREKSKITEFIEGNSKEIAKGGPHLKNNLHVLIKQEEIHIKILIALKKKGRVSKKQGGIIKL